MLTEVTATLASDDRAVNGALLDVLDRDTWSTIPELAIASAAAQGSIHGEVYGIIESYSLVGASASYGAAENAYFEQRATAAGALATQGQALHDAASGARGLDLTGRACFAVALIEDPDDCDFDTEAEALVATLLAAFEVDIDMPDDFDDDIWTVLDFCAVYAEAASSLDAAQQERIDFAIDDSFLDTRFLGRSDCRFEAGLVEDPQPDLRVGRAALESLYGGSNLRWPRSRVRQRLL